MRWFPICPLCSASWLVQFFGRWTNLGRPDDRGGLPFAVSAKGGTASRAPTLSEVRSSLPPVQFTLRS